MAKYNGDNASADTDNEANTGTVDAPSRAKNTYGLLSQHEKAIKGEKT